MALAIKPLARSSSFDRLSFRQAAIGLKYAAESKVGLSNMSGQRRRALLLVLYVLFSRYEQMSTPGRWM